MNCEGCHDDCGAQDNFLQASNLLQVGPVSGILKNVNVRSRARATTTTIAGQSASRDSLNEIRMLHGPQRRCHLARGVKFCEVGLK